MPQVTSPPMASAFAVFCFSDCESWMQRQVWVFPAPRIPWKSNDGNSPLCCMLSILLGLLCMQARKPLSTLRTLGAMLAPRLEPGEPDRDMAEGIMAQVGG